MPDIVPERRLIKGEHVNPLVELLTTFWLTVSFVFFYDWYARVRISQMVQAKKFAHDSDRTRTWAQITRGWLLSISGKKRKIIFLGDKIGKGKEGEAREDEGRETRLYDGRKGAIFPGKMDNFIAADFTTQSAGAGGRAEVSGTTMVTLVIVFPESSDKDEFYNHVEYHFVFRAVENFRRLA